MPVPKYNEFFPVVIECLMQGEVANMNVLSEFATQKMQISEDDKQVLLPSGTQSMFYNRLNWAMTYLKKAELLSSPRRGQYQITDKGIEAYKKTNGKIDMQYLNTIDSFVKFNRDNSARGDGNSQPSNSTTQTASSNIDSTPQDLLDTAYQQIKSNLVDDLLTEIMNKSPAFFERLVVDLLVKMGYGGTVENPGSSIGRTGDEGIDGVIKEDKLGFSFIYIQAKRWEPETTIGRPEIQRFFGALAGQRGSKGLFITTARFSKEAREYANSQHIVLVDGRKLAELMIDHNLGVSLKIIYELKRIDTDYFNEDE